jgi:hypothetical protein
MIPRIAGISGEWKKIRARKACYNACARQFSNDPAQHRTVDKMRVDNIDVAPAHNEEKSYQGSPDIQ